MELKRHVATLTRIIPGNISLDEFAAALDLELEDAEDLSQRFWEDVLPPVFRLIGEKTWDETSFPSFWLPSGESWQRKITVWRLEHTFYVASLGLRRFHRIYIQIANDGQSGWETSIHVLDGADHITDDMALITAETLSHSFPSRVARGGESWV